MTKKEDDEDVNSQEAIAEKLRVMKEETRKRNEANAVGGANYTTQGEITPNWEYELYGEGLHD